MTLNWVNSTGGSWCTFHGVNLGHNHFNGMEGVYIIWQGNGPIVRVGQGIVKNRIAAHRNDNAITAHDNLYVTWASVPVGYRDSVERYLALRLNPRVGDAFPNTSPLEVNLPWPYNG